MNLGDFFDGIGGSKRFDYTCAMENYKLVESAISVIPRTDGIYHAVLKGEKMYKQIQFISTSDLKTNREVHNNSKSLFTINTGFFDPNNKKSISYIINDYQTIEDPLFNEGLTQNPILRRNLKKILNNMNKLNILILIYP